LLRSGHASLRWFKAALRDAGFPFADLAPIALAPLKSSKKVGFKPSEDCINHQREILGRPRIAWIGRTERMGDENGLFAFAFLFAAVQLSIDAQKHLFGQRIVSDMKISGPFENDILGLG
jgi:hypothetical protein